MADRNEMSHNVAIYQGLYCLLNWINRELHSFGILTCGPLLCTINLPRLIVSNLRIHKYWKDAFSELIKWFTFVNKTFQI